MTTNEKLLTKASIEKMVAKAEAKLAEWYAKEEEMKRDNHWEASRGIYSGINRATESLELAKRLLAAINEGKKVYKAMNYSYYSQQGGGCSYAGYVIRQEM